MKIGDKVGSNHAALALQLERLWWSGVGTVKAVEGWLGHNLNMVIHQWSQQVCIGPVLPDTQLGKLAHLCNSVTFLLCKRSKNKMKLNNLLLPSFSFSFLLSLRTLVFRLSLLLIAIPGTMLQHQSQESKKPFATDWSNILYLTWSPFSWHHPMNPHSLLIQFGPNWVSKANGSILYFSKWVFWIHNM